VNQADGTLTAIDWTPTQGKTPRHFAITPSGAYLYAENQDSDTIVVFRVDAATGRLTPTGETFAFGSPSCIAFSSATARQRTSA
jgi:6-phosphogluconolactonase